jgi:DNA-binding NarL/FixJ family response regulator
MQRATATTLDALRKETNSTFPMITKIGLVEDDEHILVSMREWIDNAPGYKCVCSCANAETALVEVPKQDPDVILMDINLPGESGIACTVRLKELKPAVQIIMLTVFRDPKLLFQSLKAGACGYLLKRSSPDDIFRAIAEVRAGGAPMSGEIARMVIEAFLERPKEAATGEKLSQREVQILSLLSKGLSNKEIGDQLGITCDTVRAHLRRIYERLHVRCRVEAVNKYLNRHLDTLPKERENNRK